MTVQGGARGRPIPGSVRTLAAALSLGLVCSTAAAQDVFLACEGDIASYCSAVEPGHGRLMACLYAHEDKVGESCDQAIGETADVIDQVFARLRYVAQECGEDIRAHCKDVAIGEGRVYSCLHERRETLSQSCAQVIDDVRLPTD